MRPYVWGLLLNSLLFLPQSNCLYRFRMHKIALRDGIRRPAGVENELLPFTIVIERICIFRIDCFLVGYFVGVQLPLVRHVNPVPGFELIHLAEYLGVLRDIPRIPTGVTIDHDLATRTGIAKEVPHAVFERSENTLRRKRIYGMCDGEVRNPETRHRNGKILL